MKVDPVKGLVATLALAPLAAGANFAANVAPRQSTSSSSTQKTRLYAGIHPELDQDDLVHLKSNKSASFFYAQQASQSANETQLAAELSATLHYETVILDHISTISSVVCQDSQIDVTFNSASIFAKAQKHWNSEHEDLVLVSSQSGCHDTHDGQFGFFNATAMAFNEADLSVVVSGSRLKMTDVVNEYTLSWGEYTAASTSSARNNTQNLAKRVATGNSSSGSSSSSSSTTALATSTIEALKPAYNDPCGTLPTSIPAGLPQVKKSFGCGTAFDKAVDDYLGYLGDDSNFDTAIAAFAPGVAGLTLEAYESASADVETSLRRRCWVCDAWDWVDDNIVEPVVNVVETVVEDVVAVVQVLTEVAEEAVDAIKRAAEAIMPSWSPSLSFTIPVNMAAPDWMLDDSPWGDAYQIYEWKKGEGDVNYGINADSLAKLTGANELLTFEIDGVTQLPIPGIQVYCVDCAVTGSFKVTGSVTYTLLVGFTAITVDLSGNLQASIQLGLNAYAEYEHTVASVRLLTIPIDGFEIPEIITVGPAITFDVDATVEVDALGQVLAGATLTWAHMGAHLDVYNLGKTTGHGFDPQISPVFNISGQVNATASVGIPIGFGIEIDILDGEWRKEIALVDRPAIQAVASYSASNTGDTEDNCKGILWYANFVNELKFELFDEDHMYDIGSWEGPAFVQGCIGDDGKSTVSQQQQPASSDKTLAGCTLVDDLITNNGFSIWQDNLVPPWHNRQSDGTSMYVEQDSVASSGDSMAFYASGMDNTKTYTGTVLQEITVCTDALYDVSFSARIVDCGTGICNLTSVTVYSNYNSYLDVGVYPNLYISPNSNYMQSYGPYDFAVPAFNNDASETMWLAITFTTSYTQSWDIRVSDIHVVPDGSDYSNKKRSAIIVYEEGFTGSMQSLDNLYDPALVRRDTDSSPLRPAHLLRRDSSNSDTPVPTLVSIPALPVITPVNAIPAIGDWYTTALSTQSANYAAPTQSANLNAPTLSYISMALPSGSQPASIDPTATASLVGPCDYSFPARSNLMASATKGTNGGGALPTAGASADAQGFTQLRDTSNTVQLASGPDGNLYLAAAAAASSSPQSLFYSSHSVIAQDVSSRTFHYYPATMDAYGVSRLRIASLAETPLTAQLVTLVPVHTEVGNVYAAADTLGKMFYLAWCNAADWLGAKVFLVSDYAESIDTLMSRGVQWIVTGDEVTMCYPLLLTSGAAPIAA
ncbi:hypothetical protein BJX65DRAFT_311109 [Aspergillus insuetus]